MLPKYYILIWSLGNDNNNNRITMPLTWCCKRSMCALVSEYVCGCMCPQKVAPCYNPFRYGLLSDILHTQSVLLALHCQYAKYVWRLCAHVLSFFTDPFVFDWSGLLLRKKRAKKLCYRCWCCNTCSSYSVTLISPALYYPADFDTLWFFPLFPFLLLFVRAHYIQFG